MLDWLKRLLEAQRRKELLEFEKLDKETRGRGN